MQRIIAGKTIEDWQREYPLLAQIISLREVFWVNPLYGGHDDKNAPRLLGEKDIEDAEKRLVRFAPFIAKTFPATQATNGLIESPLAFVPKMREKMGEMCGRNLLGTLYVKCDSHLPISGSIKARGGIYEVLKVAESIAKKHRLLSETDDYSILAGEEFKHLFSHYSLVVGSTGNLGLSIGIVGAVMGFKVIVHMSADAKQWKKDLLRSKGVIVVEHTADYSRAVEAGRDQARLDGNSHFVDDENSRDLLLGYAVAAKRLKQQLADSRVVVDQDHPLFVYLPCGVGGGPGGVTFGLKSVFGNNVHCFFAEPTHSPAMLVGLLTRLHDKVSVQEFGIDNITDADGLAVGKPSGVVGKLLERDISGVFTVEDGQLYRLLRSLADTEDLYLEPSALAGFAGPAKLLADPAGKKYLEERNIMSRMENATHIVWATGGSMVPPAVMKDFYDKGVAKP